MDMSLGKSVRNALRSHVVLKKCVYGHVYGHTVVQHRPTICLWTCLWTNRCATRCVPTWLSKRSFKIICHHHSCSQEVRVRKFPRAASDMLHAVIVFHHHSCSFACALGTFRATHSSLRGRHLLFALFLHTALLPCVCCSCCSFFRCSGSVAPCASQ